MGLGKMHAFLMGVFGGAVSGQGATTGQALVKQANGSWAPGTVSGGSASQFVATSDGSTAAPAFRGTDANTGVYFPAANEAAISAGGTRVLFASLTQLLLGQANPVLTLNEGTETATLAVRATVLNIADGNAYISTDGSVSLIAGTDAGEGVKVGAGSGQKIGFFNTTPVTQRTGIADPSGGATVDTQARAAITSVITALEQLGLLATV